MKRIYLLLLTCTFVISVAAQNNDLCTPTAFLKEITHPLQNTYISGQSLCLSNDGNLFIGLEWRAFGPNSLIIKMTPTGEVLWSRQLFWNEYSYFRTTITQMILDSDGMLIISGMYQPGNANEFENFICRYDPVQDIVRWAKRMPFAQYFYTYKVVEKQSGGNYILYRTLVIGDNYEGGQEVELMEISRQNGTTISNSTKTIGGNESSSFTSVLSYQGNLYAAGTQAEDGWDTPGGNLLCKMNLAGTHILWANVSSDVSEKVTNVGLLIDQDTLVSLYQGWDESVPGQIRTCCVYLQKSTLDGQLVWTRRYETPELSSTYGYNIVALASGYLIIGVDSQRDNYGRLTSDYFVLNTDKAGHIQHSGYLPTPTSFQGAGSNYGNGTNNGGNSIIVMDESLYFTGTFFHYVDNWQNLIDFSEAFLIKSATNQTSLDSCPFAPLGYPIIETSIPNPTTTPIPLTITPSTATLNNFTMYTAPDSAAITTTCARCDAPCGPILSLGPDQEFAQDTTVLLQAGTGYISYLWQDGSTSPNYLAAAGGTYWVEVKDGCGFVQRDTIQLSLDETVCDSKDQACIHWDLLDVKATATGDLRFRFKLTNNCASSLQQVDFQVPAGMVATQPVHQSIYTAPSSGRSYTVRNPNFSPFYSLRFRANSAALSNGASDIFTYDLPGQAAPAYIHTAVKLANGNNYEAYLNTFHCPPAEAGNRGKSLVSSQGGILLPNPSNGTLWLDLPEWKNQTVQVRILNTQGQVLQTMQLADGEEQRAMQLSSRLANGLYYAVVQGENEGPLTLRFVLAR